MSTSENINELVGALSKAQAEMDNAPMLSTNPHFRSKYADLASIRNATIPPLSKNGLALFQTISGTENGGLSLVTRLAHTSGQWAESRYPLPNSSKPHEMGSAITYARRYSWAAVCGIAAEEDDDGNNAQEGAKNGVKAVPARKSSAAAKRDGDWEKFEAALRDCQSAREVEKLRAEYERDVYPAWNVDWRDVATEAFAKRLAEFSAGPDLKQTLQDSLEDPEQFRERIRDQMIERIQTMDTEADLLVWKESPGYRGYLDSLPKPMQFAVRKAGATKLESLQKAAR